MLGYTRTCCDDEEEKVPFTPYSPPEPIRASAYWLNNYTGGGHTGTQTTCTSSLTWFAIGVYGGMSLAPSSSSSGFAALGSTLQYLGSRTFLAVITYSATVLTTGSFTDNTQLRFGLSTSVIHNPGQANIQLNANSTATVTSSIIVELTAPVNITPLVQCLNRSSASFYVSDATITVSEIGSYGM